MKNNNKIYEAPLLMNLELTTKCPLRCPQCYCKLTGGRDLPLEEAVYWIEEAARCKVEYINLSGGETMCYPHLFPLLEKIHTLGMKANVALSGAGFERKELEDMKKAGIHEICISLNGPTDEINAMSRQGFDLAIKALELLKEDGFQNTCINWVMHRSNADYLEDMAKLAEEYCVKELVIMVFKPDSEHERKGLPTREQIEKTAHFIKNYHGSVSLSAESCFSQLRVLLGERFFGNLNRGVDRGCGAGRDGISVNIDGKLTPCRHLEYPEDTKSLSEYWNNSEILKQLRQVEEHLESPCSGCKYNRNCLPCMAVNAKMKNRISFGDTSCELWKRGEVCHEN